MLFAIFNFGRRKFEDDPLVDYKSNLNIKVLILFGQGLRLQKVQVRDGVLKCKYNFGSLAWPLHVKSEIKKPQQINLAKLNRFPPSVKIECGQTWGGNNDDVPDQPWLRTFGDISHPTCSN